MAGRVEDATVGRYRVFVHKHVCNIRYCYGPSCLCDSHSRSLAHWHLGQNVSPERGRQVEESGSWAYFLYGGGCETGPGRLLSEGLL